MTMNADDRTPTLPPINGTRANSALRPTRAPALQPRAGVVDAAKGLLMRRPTRVIVALVLGVLAATPSVAQTPGDKWQLTAAPYFLGASMNGTSGIAGQEVTVDMSFGDILSNLQFGAMGLVVARNSSIAFGYRWLDINYSTGENQTAFKYDVLSQGPVLGFAFRF